MQYLDKLAGCFIVDNNRRWFKKEQWNTTNNSNARGVAFSDGDYAFIIYKENYGKMAWGPTGVVESILFSPTTTTIDQLLSDSEGEFQNGAQFNMGADSSDCILELIQNEWWADHKGIWDGDNLVSTDNPMCYVGSAWEWAMVDLNIDELEDLMSYIGGDDIAQTCERQWTCFQSDADTAIGCSYIGGGYGLSSSTFTYRPKSDTSYNVRVFYRAWIDEQI